MKYTCKRAVALLFSVFLLTLCACQKTPEKKAVVSKSGGIAKENTIDRMNDGEVKEMDIPAHWKETMESDDGRVRVIADLDMEKMSVSNTPVREMSSKQLTQKRLEELVKYFAGDKKLYVEPRMTKSELQVILEQMDNREGRYIEWSLSDDGKRERAAELQSKALEVRAEKEYVKPAFTFPIKTERQEINGSEFENIVLTEKNTVDVRVDAGKPGDPKIFATQYNENAGTTSCFSYKKNESISETWIEQSEEIERYYDIQTTEKSEKERQYEKENNAMFRKAISGEPSVSLDKAKELAEKLMSDLKIKGMGLLKIERAGIIENRPYSMYVETADWSSAKVGYLLTYSTVVEDILVEGNISAGSRDGLPEEEYQPPLMPERIEVIITNEGIVEFSWYNMAKKEAVVVENTKLLPFEQIKEKLMAHTYYSRTSPDPKKNPDKSVMIMTSAVKAVNLQYVYTTAYEEPNHAWLVPAWVFTTEDSYTFYGKTVPVIGGKTALSAIDGSFIKLGKVGK